MNAALASGRAGAANGMAKAALWAREAPTAGVVFMGPRDLRPGMTVGLVNG